MPDTEILVAIREDVALVLDIVQGKAGTPGLVTKHELLAASVHRCQETHAHQRKDFRFWAMFVVAVGSVLVAWIK